MTQPLLQSVDNALRIIELFEGPVKELSLTEISRTLGLGKSTVYRLLSTLEARGFIEQNPDSGRYLLGMRLVHIGANKLGNINVIEECRPILERLSSVTGESTHLSFYATGRTTCVDTVRGSNPALLAPAIGHSGPAYASAPGKTFLAYMERNELDEMLRFLDLQPRTPYTITNRLDLIAELERIRENGCAEEQQESHEGLVSFSAPVWGAERKLLAAMGISGAASRMNAHKAMLVREITAAAQTASRRCGCNQRDSEPGATGAG